MASAEKFSKMITCPHCKEQVSLTVQQETNVTLVIAPAEQFEEVAGRNNVARGGPSSNLSLGEESILASAREQGLITAFINAFKAAHSVEPKNAEKAFLAWMRSMAPKQICRAVLEYLRKEYGGRIDFASSQSVGAVLCDGMVVQIVPCQVVGERSLRVAKGGAVISTTDEFLVKKTEEWIRTKYGYVAKSGAYLDAMRKKSFGEFCRPIM